MATAGGGFPGVHGRRLRHEVLSLRRRARARLLARALLAALAADLLYDLAGIGVAWLTGRSIHFPPFFLVAFAVFALMALRATGLRAFARRLDGEHGLKSRLAAAEEYRRSAAVPPAIVEAQAKETLRSVDFPGIRRSLRLNPAVPLGLIALSGGLLGFVLWRFPGMFRPGNVLFRQGGAIVSRLSHPPVEGPRLAAGGAGGRRADPGGAPRPSGEAGKPEAPRESAKTAPPERAPQERPPQRAGGEKPPPQAERRRSSREPPHARREEKPGPPSTVPRKGGGPPGDGGGIAKVPSVEVTERPSALAAKPRPGLAPPGAPADPRRGGAYLPPIPLFRLLAGSRAGSLVDPDTIQIVPEAYDARYRGHIVAYFEKLRALRGGADGS